MIFIDASRYNNTKKRTGVENYSYFLIQHLTKHYSDNLVLISPRAIDLKVEQIVIPFRRLWTHVRLSWEVFRNKAIETLFVPSHVLPLIHPKRSIITIHDVAFKHSPKSYSRKSRWYLNWATRFAVKHAYRIITPSEKTKADLKRYYGCDPSKIRVIPLGFLPSSVSLKAAEQLNILKQHDLEKGKYFLYVGRIEHKKNSDALIKAFIRFSENNKTTKLVMAGFVGHGGEAILKLIPAHLKNRIVLPGFISEEEKYSFLHNAMAFVFPSREEGFGIPLLEAMDAKLPIIASKIPTSQEIASNNALFFDVDDVQKLSQLMTQVSEAKKGDDLMTQKHAESLKKYNWDSCAKQVYEVLNEA